MVNAMARLSAVFLLGILIGAGCGSATGQTRTADDRPSGVAGQTVALVCGGPASEQGCARRPVAATIDVLRMPSARRVDTVHTDSRGHFRIDVPPSTYKLQARTSTQLIRVGTVTTRVLPHKIKHVTITFAPRHPLPVAPGSASG